MVKNVEKIACLFALTLGIVACCTPKKVKDDPVPENRTTCLTAGTVKDMRGLDGCTFLIILENGQKLLPARLPDPDFQFREGQKVRFDYKKSTAGASICMAEDMIVDISCLEETD